jgi:16S rRNA (guanine966-N2)-methyltransferase
VSRIVGGSRGGRRLVMPSGRRTRPTSERMREGLFSSLGADVSGRSFLDLYAGSGAVGLEAASRGAAPVVLVERDPSALRALRTNVAALELPGVAVHAQPVSAFLAADAVEFDVVFLDPPYADDVAGVLLTLATRGWLAAGATVVVERASRGSPPTWPDGIAFDRSRRYGEGTLWYGRRP